MHPVTSVGMGITAQQYGMQPMTDPNQPSDGQVHTGPGEKKDIGDLLQQVMSITDQSMDEAQAR